MKRFKIFCIAVLVLAISIPLLAPLAMPYCHYNTGIAVKYITQNAEPKSKNCCAWYVMRAMQVAGCPIYILPAYAYSWLLPQYGFIEVDSTGYTPQAGDIAVFPAVDGHIWGHIQMWNGSRWISDFKQKGFYAARGYMNCGYKIFRYAAPASSCEQ